jgi:hypothetical protein
MLFYEGVDLHKPEINRNLIEQLKESFISSFRSEKIDILVKRISYNSLFN